MPVMDGITACDKIMKLYQERNQEILEEFKKEHEGDEINIQ